MIADIYSSPNLQSSISLPHPHRLALLFAVLALAAVLDSNSHSSAAGYYSCCQAALSAGDFMNDVSVTSLCAMHIVCGYILNADGRSQELYVLTGFALRLAVAAGFHRGV